MKYDRLKNPALCSNSKRPDKYGPDGVAVLTIDGKTYLASTDGRMAVAVRAEPSDGDQVPQDGGASRIYPTAAFTAACKGAIGFSAEVVCNGSAKVRTREGAVAEYPATEAHFPDLGAIARGFKAGAVDSIVIDAAALAVLAKALGTDAVRLEFSGADGVVRVSPCPIKAPGKAGKKTKAAETDGSIGFIMPCAS